MKNRECLDESMSPTRELQSSRVGMIPYQTQLPAFIIIVIRRFPRNDYVFQAVAKQVRTVCLLVLRQQYSNPPAIGLLLLLLVFASLQVTSD